MTFQIGDRVRVLPLEGEDFQGVAIVESVYYLSEDYDYYVKSVSGEWIAPFEACELEFIAHAPNSLDDVSNEEWNASQGSRYARD